MKLTHIIGIFILILATFISVSFAEAAPLTGTPVLPVACTFVDANISFGMRDRTTNGSVVNIQAFLHNSGYLSVEPTGYFGALTLHAVKKFQAAYALPQTGYFGPMSREKMKALTCTDNGSGAGVPSPTKDMAVSITTDKKTYTSSESIVMTLTAVNNSNSDTTLIWNNGCKTSYKIDTSFDSTVGQMCTMIYGTQVLKAHETLTLSATHRPEDYKLSAGQHMLTGSIKNVGEATTTIQVTQ